MGLAVIASTGNKPAMITINDARITFVYGECFTGNLGRVGSEDEELLWDELLYEWGYNQIRGDMLQGYAFPWRDSQKSAFWRHYLGDSPGSVPADDAWKRFVPLRLLFDTSDILTNAAERVQIDVFGFPFGIVAALTVHVAKGASMPMADWISRLRTLRFRPEFREGSHPRTLEEVLGLLLDRARSLFYLGAPAGTRSDEPISVNTVLQAEGGAPRDSVSQELQRELHSVTAWPADWENAVLPPAEAPAFLPIRSKNQVPGDVHYAVGRGRTVWRPGLFARHTPSDGPKRRHTLSCLTHNLVAGSVQAEMLRLFAVRLASVGGMRGQIDTGTIRRLARIIDCLRRGENTFRSTSIQQQLEDKSSKAAVNEALKMANAPLIP